MAKRASWLWRLWKLWEVWAHVDTAGGIPAWFTWGRRALTAVTSGTLLGGWLARATHWPLPVVVIAGIAAAGFVLFLLNQLQLRGQLNVAAAPDPGDDKPKKPVVTDAAQLSATYLQGKPFRIVDIPRNGVFIDNRTFEDCVIYGPGIVVIMDGTTVMECEFSGDAKPESLVWTFPIGSTVVGPIGLRHCVFRRCQFRGVGVAGTPEFVARFTKQLARTP